MKQLINVYHVIKIENGVRNVIQDFMQRVEHVIHDQIYQNVMKVNEMKNIVQYVIQNGLLKKENVPIVLII